MITAFLLGIFLQLPSGARAVSGMVLDSSGVPIAGAAIRSWSSDRQSRETLSGGDGMFVLNAVPAGPLTLVVSARGFAERTVHVAGDASAPLEIVLSPSGFAETIDVSGNPERLRVNTPVSATVVDADTLATSPSLTIDDQLRSIPGFSLFRRSSSRVANPTTQGVTLRGLAASGASRTAVLADGLPLNDPFGGWVYWDRVPAAAIERIEVARGGSSDLHGSDALGGAIRITTARRPGARLWADGGARGSARLSAYAAQELARWLVSGAVEASTTDGYIVVAPEARGPVDVPAFSEYTSARAGVSVPVFTESALELDGGYFSEDRGNGTPFQTNATIVRHVSGRGAGSVWGGAWAARAAGASQDYDQTFSAVSDDRVSERPTSVQHVDIASADLHLEWVRGGPRHATLVSFAARDVRADLLQGPPAGSLTLTAAGQRTFAGTVQASFQPADRLTVGLGTRGEIWRSELRHGGDARTLSRVAPRVSVAWRISPDVSIRSAVHQAYRTPTMNELHRPFRVGDVVTLANPELDAESSLGVEGAVLARRGPAAVRLTAFWTRLSDAIVNVTLESSPAGIIRQRQNAGRIRAAGIELEADARVLPILSVTAAAAYVDSIFTEGAGLDGLRVPQVPRWQLSAGVQGLWRRVSMSLDWRVIGSQFDDDRNQFLLDESGMVNARAGWRLRPSLEVFGAIENAFDQEQDVGRTPIRTIGLPRTARIGLRWHP